MKLRFVGILCFIAGLGSAPSFAGRPLIIYSNDVMGELEPCHCRKNPRGGMARKKNLINKLDANSFLQIDSGNLLFPNSAIPPLLRDQAKLQAKYVIRAYNELDHHFAVPGTKDFALGYDVFREITSEAKFNYLSINATVRSSGKPLFPGTWIVERKTATGKSFKIGLIGLLGEKLPWPKEILVKPVIESAQKAVKQLHPKVDLLIALTHQSTQDDQALAQAVPEIDLIFGGGEQAFLQKPLVVRKTKIYQTSFRNQHVGVLAIAPRKEFQGKTHGLEELTENYNSPTKKKNSLDRLVDKFKASVAELNEKAESKETEKLRNRSAHFQTFPKCAECHLKQFDFWRRTPHAIALTSLRERNQLKNKECLSCHTLGLGHKKGIQEISQISSLQIEKLESYLESIHDAKNLKSRIKFSGKRHRVRDSLSELSQVWAPVQCENCHQPGREHPFLGNYKKDVEKTACLKCHTPDQAPSWYTKGKPNWGVIQKKRLSITCPTGEIEP